MAGAVVRKYARALVEVALENNSQEKVAADLNHFIQLFEENGELHEVLQNPALPLRAKHEIVRQISVRMDLAAEVTNFVNLLLKNNRIQSLAQMRQVFQDVLNEKLGVVSGEVFTAASLNNEQKADIERGVTKLTGKKVQLGYNEEPSLIGGIKIHLGSTVYDATVSKQLEEIRRRIQ
jgi:F-type H+-transporting ATPase subunit delta